MKSETSSLLLGSVAGMAVGYASFLLASPLVAPVLAVAVAAGLSFSVSKWIARDIAPEKRGLKWWLTNGGMSYFAVWFVVWVLALNLIK